MARDPDPEPAAALARAALSALRRRRYDAPRGLYGRRRLNRFVYATLWPHANAWAASVAVGALEPRLLPSPVAAAASLAFYRAGRAERPAGLDSSVVPPLGRGGTRYYDDNAWIALAALRHAAVTPEPALVRLAGELADFVASGWAENPALARPGGIFWREVPEPRGRNTCANAPAAALFAALGLLGDVAAGTFAARVYAWTRGALCTGAGLYADRIDPDGRREETIWSYNQGAMVGAGVLLAELTGEAAYLNDAVGTAQAALARYEDVEHLAAEPPAFAAVFFRNLFALGARRADPRYAACARSWIAAVARTQLSPGGLVGAGDQVNATAAFAEVAALLAGAPPGP